MMRRAATAEAAAVLLAAAALAVYFTFPLALSPASLGRVDSGDGQFSIWNAGWVARALTTTGTRALFDANIFHPHRNTLAYSEPNLGAGALGAPAFFLTGSAVAAHNWAFLLALVLSVCGMYVLVRYLIGRRDAALLAGILYTFCPYLFAHTAHIQLLMTFGVPWVLFAFHRLADAPSAGRAAVLGLALAVLALFCGYYGILAGILLVYAVLFHAVSRGLWRRPGWWGLSGLAAAVAVLLVVPFVIPVLRVSGETGFARELNEARVYAADWRAYLASAAWFHRWMLPYLGSWREVLFPGFVSLFLAAFAVFAVARGTDTPVPAGQTRLRELTAFYAGLVVLSVWISLGPAGGLYSVLYEIIPVFSLLRAPSRFGIAVIFGLAVLAAIGLSRLATPAPRGRLVAVVVVLAAILELSMTMPFRRIDPAPPAYVALASLPRGVVVELPFFHRHSNFHLHARYMFNSTYHWMPLVNGYSDHVPRDFSEIALPLASFPNIEGFAVLRARRGRYVVVHPGRYTYDQRQTLMKRLEQYREYLRPRVSGGDVWLYEIVAWPPEVQHVQPLEAGR